MSTDLNSVDSRITRSGEFIDSDDSSKSGDFGEKYSNFSEPMFTYQLKIIHLSVKNYSPISEKNFTCQ